jgi:hypothetical protein
MNLSNILRCQSVRNMIEFQDETPFYAVSGSTTTTQESGKQLSHIQQPQSFPVFHSQLLPSSTSLGQSMSIISQPQERFIITPTFQISCDYTRGRGPLLYFHTDDGYLTEQQIFIRKQIEFFEVSLNEVGKTTSGRKHPIMKNQVGIQCRHCAVIPLRYRERGAVYFPAKLLGIYQAAQNIAGCHMIQLCKHIDNETKEILKTNKQTRCLGNGGKKYWAETANAQGIVDTLLEKCLCYAYRNISDNFNHSGNVKSQR